MSTRYATIIFNDGREIDMCYALEMDPEGGLSWKVAGPSAEYKSAEMSEIKSITWEDE